ncbi:MAG: LVIVD repeat-containing protein [Gemmatimonadales bacterium]
MTPVRLLSLPSAVALALMLGCAGSTSSTGSGGPVPSGDKSARAPSPDPRVGLRGGLADAGEAVWNLKVISETPAPKEFAGVTNSDLAFTGKYVIQGNYNGFQVWDIENPRQPKLTTSFVCPASQSDVSVYRNLLFVSGEDLSARLDCGTQGVPDTVSAERLRGLRIFDISDIRHPKNVGNVQTCRGSHTHSVLVDPKDSANVYVYISGSSMVRSPNELEGCVAAMPDEDPNSAWFRIEVIKVPLAHPEQAAIVSSPRIFDNLVAPKGHGDTPADSAAAAKELADAKAAGKFIVTIQGEEVIISDAEADTILADVVAARQGSGPPTAADSATLRRALPLLMTAVEEVAPDSGTGPTQCHDITLYPAIGLAGGACEGYGMLLDIENPVAPVRIAAVADSNFSYWHSATFNNDGTRILFSDEWGGGSQAKCRVTDKKEWGADAIFTIEDRKLQFQGYYKLPAPQTAEEVCVAHNGSLIPIPGRDVMVQAWYQGGLSVFDWTDAANPVEIAYFDRGPVDTTRLASGGYWSTYWYNGLIIGSEIARGLDIFELTPSAVISQNEIDAAKSVRFDYFNVQGQRKFVWPATFALARAYLDQLERSEGMASDEISAAREALASAEKGSDAERREELTGLATRLDGRDSAKVGMLADVVKQLAAAPRLARGESVSR